MTSCLRNLFFLALVTSYANAQQYLVTTIGGGGAVPTASAAVNSPIGEPHGVAVDAYGDTYFSTGNLIYKVDSAGTLIRIAGSPRTAGFSGDGGPALSAELNNAGALAVDGAGNLFFTDSDNVRVRKIAVDGTISTVAGNGVRGALGDGGPATAASLVLPTGLAIDSSGNLYIADRFGYVRKVAVDGVISTVVGSTSQGYSGDGGLASAALIGSPVSVALDPSGNLYIADIDNNVIRKVTPTGFISTVAGSGSPGFSGDDGKATNAMLSFPDAVVVNSKGEIIISDSGNSRLRKVALDGTIATVQGSDKFGGSSTNSGIALDAIDNLYTVGPSLIERVTPDGMVATIAGNGDANFAAEGKPAIVAQLNNSAGLAADANGNVYLVDFTGPVLPFFPAGGRVRKISAAGTISTIAGTGAAGFSGDGGPAIDALLSDPGPIAVDSDGNLFIVDAGNFRVRRVSTSGVISTVAGSGSGGFSGDGGPALNAAFGFLDGIAVDKTGNLYLADVENDFLNSRIRKVSTDGNVSTYIAGLAVPSALTIDANGNVYFVGQSVVNKVDTNGVLTTVANTDVFARPYFLSTDAANNVYVTDYQGMRIGKLTPAGSVSWIAGDGTAFTARDGVPALSTSATYPAGIAASSSGVIYFQENLGLAVRALVPENTSAVLQVTVAPGGHVNRGQTGATYSITVSNPLLAGTTFGETLVSFTLPPGYTFVSATGAGWTCSTTCTRRDALAGGSSYPPITLTINVSPTALPQASVTAAVSGGGSVPGGATDVSFVYDAPTPPVPTLNTPASGTGGVSLAQTLSWSSANNTYYDVYLGTTPQPPLVATVGGPHYQPAALDRNATYYWKVVARNPTGSAESAVGSFITSSIAQTITFDHLSAHVFGDPPFSVAATASSGLPVTFEASGQCNITGTTITIRAPGSCTVIASQSGSESYLPVSVSQTFAIAKGQPAINWRPAPLVYGTALGANQLNASANLPGIFTYSPAAGTLLNAGLQYLYATFTPTDSTDFAEVDVSMLFDVTPAPQIISFAPIMTHLSSDAPFALKATVDTGNPVIFSIVSGPATIAGNILTITGVGDLTVQARAAATRNYTVAMATQTFTVFSADSALISAVTNSASFATGPLAPNEIGVIFGRNLAIVSAIAVQDLPAQLLFVSDSQINFVVPAQAQPGQGTLRLTASSQTVSSAVEVAAIAPGVYSANSTGTGPAAGSAMHIAADGTQTYTPLTDPIAFNATDERIFLILYGTGLNNASVTATIANTAVPVAYAGPQTQYPGLDQINLELPHALAGTGATTVQIIAGTQRANTLDITIQ